MSFDSDSYWIKRGKTYEDEFKKKRLINKIQFWIQERYIENAIDMVARKTDVEHITDMGCGFGRITKMLCRRFPYAIISGSDISPDQLKKARQSIPRAYFYTDSITEFGWTWDNDLITVIEVLMHLPADKIEAAIKTLKLASNGFVITVDWFTEDAVDIYMAKQAGFCFLHDYKELFEAQGFRLYNEQKIAFVAQKIRIWERV